MSPAPPVADQFAVDPAARTRWRVGAWCWGALVLATTLTGAQVKERFVTTDARGGLVYRAAERGDRIPDFSHAGYAGGGVPLPVPPIRIVVEPSVGDDGARIQAALDQVAAMPPDADGLRGAVYLAPGRFEVAGQLRLTASGVVLRGAGSGEDGTVVVATGQGRRTLIEIAGAGDRRRREPTHVVSADYVPVGVTTLTLTNRSGLVVGDRVWVERQPNDAWLSALGMDVAPARTPYRWKRDDVVVGWDRTIVAVDGPRITLNAPLTTALDPAFGTATVAVYEWPERLRNVGVEHLRCVSVFDGGNPRDEEHAWMAVALDAVEDAWVADVTAVHFVSSAVHVGAGARAVTVQDCQSLAPVSELAGYRRQAFHTSGQLTLFQRCRSEDGRDDFTV
ncbi:MAG TPA: hypothetical protein VHF69_13680, partial [Candidatus Synoicihabitans sp.]|nr:hypothetical protein [Candidatus Synoicihabitans sp.]